jgi:nucleoside-diphosphate-sugar epimerase
MVLGSPGYGAVQVHESDAGRKSIDVYNYGKMKRDFTYIDDIVEAIVGCRRLSRSPIRMAVETGSPADSSAPYGCITLATAHRLNLWITSPRWKRLWEWWRRKYDAHTTRRCAGHQRRYPAAV